MRYLLVSAALATVLAGCGRSGEQASPSQHANHDKNGTVQAQQATGTGRASASKEELQDHLEALAKSIPQVKDAKCVILGKTAIVGITVDPAMERSRVNTIKYSVAEAFRKDPEGIDAFVTADLGLGQRIRGVRDDIRAGRPFSGFAQELGDIIGRIMPQLPKNLQPMEDPNRQNPDAKQFQSNNL